MLTLNIPTLPFSLHLRYYLTESEAWHTYFYFRGIWQWSKITGKSSQQRGRKDCSEENHENSLQVSWCQWQLCNTDMLETTWWIQVKIEVHIRFSFYLCYKQIKMSYVHKNQRRIFHILINIFNHLMNKSGRLENTWRNSIKGLFVWTTMMVTWTCLITSCPTESTEFQDINVTGEQWWRRNKSSRDRSKRGNLCSSKVLPITAEWTQLLDTRSVESWQFWSLNTVLVKNGIQDQATYPELRI